jgi:hypothetical protein
MLLYCIVSLLLLYREVELFCTSLSLSLFAFWCFGHTISSPYGRLLMHGPFILVFILHPPPPLIKRSSASSTIAFDLASRHHVPTLYYIPHSIQVFLPHGIFDEIKLNVQLDRCIFVYTIVDCVQQFVTPVFSGFDLFVKHAISARSCTDTNHESISESTSSGKPRVDPYKDRIENK